jgi:opacity protein-like surface antigen
MIGTIGRALRATNIPVCFVGLALMPVTAVQAETADRFTGTYVGAVVGYQFGDGDAAGYRAPSKAFLGTFGDITADAINGGVQLGYTAAIGQGFVLGVEGDWLVSGADETAIVGTVKSHADIESFGTLRARAGVVVGSALVYATAGLALTNIGYSGVTPTGSVYSVSHIRPGLAAGGGVEWALDAHWSAKLEGLHVATGKQTITAPDGVSTFESQSFTTSRVGLNYKF